MANILVVDDEQGIRGLLSEILGDEGHHVELAENAAQARAARHREEFDLILLDIWMPDTDGVTLLKEWAANGLLNVPVIMMSGHATIDTAVDATRIGAIAFLEKPIALQKLLKAVEQGLMRHQARKLNTSISIASNPASATLRSDLASNLAHHAVALVSSVVDPSALAKQTFDLNRPLRDARDEFERAYFTFHLIQESNSMTRVADKTGLERTHLYRKLRQLGIDLTRSKKPSP